MTECDRTPTPAIDRPLGRNEDHTRWLLGVGEVVKTRPRGRWIMSNTRVWTAMLVGMALALALGTARGADGVAQGVAEQASADVAANARWAAAAFGDGAGARGVPFTFVYGARASTELLPQWQRQTSSERLDATRTRRTLTLTDPETQLEVRAVATVFSDTP